MIEKTGKYPPICIMPEGGTTNNKGLLKYKKGGFVGLVPVKPIILKFSFWKHGIDPACSIDIFHHIIL